MARTEARAHGFGRRQARLKVSFQSPYRPVIGMPWHAHEALSDGILVHGVYPCPQFGFGRKRNGDLIGMGEHDNLRNVENVLGQITRMRMTTAVGYDMSSFQRRATDMIIATSTVATTTRKPDMQISLTVIIDCPCFRYAAIPASTAGRQRESWCAQPVRSPIHETNDKHRSSRVQMTGRTGDQQSRLCLESKCTTALSGLRASY